MAAAIRDKSPSKASPFGHKKGPILCTERVTCALTSGLPLFFKRGQRYDKIPKPPKDFGKKSTQKFTQKLRRGKAEPETYFGKSCRKIKKNSKNCNKFAEISLFLQRNLNNHAGDYKKHHIRLKYLHRHSGWGNDNYAWLSFHHNSQETTKQKTRAYSCIFRNRSCPRSCSFLLYSSLIFVSDLVLNFQEFNHGLLEIFRGFSSHGIQLFFH